MTLTFRSIVILFCALAPVVGARGADAPPGRGVHDSAGFFSEDAEARATAAIDKVRQARGKDVLIETFDAVPAGKVLAEFARERATAAKLSGVYVIIVRKGGQVGVLPDKATAAGAFTAAATAELRDQIVADMRKGTKNFDAALSNAVESIAARLGGKDVPASAAAATRPVTVAATRPGRPPRVVLAPAEAWDAARDARARVRLVMAPESKVRGTFTAVQKLKVDDLDAEMSRKYKDAAAEPNVTPAQLDAKRDEMAVAAAKSLGAILNEEQLAAVELDVRALKRRDAAARQQVECVARAKKILAACLAYAAEHEFAFPPDLGTLAVERNVDLETFLCPATETPVPAAVRDGTKEAKAAWVNQHAEYVYLGKGQKTTVAPAFVLLHDKVGHRAAGEGSAQAVAGGVTIGYGDGEVDFVADADARAVLEAVGRGQNPPR